MNKLQLTISDLEIITDGMKQFEKLHTELNKEPGCFDTITNLRLYISRKNNLGELGYIVYICEDIFAFIPYTK